MEHLFPIQYSYLIPLLPLAGAAIAGFFGAKWLKGLSHWPIWIGVGISAILSIMLLFGVLNLNKQHAQDAPSKDAASNAMAVSINWYSWIPAGDPTKPGTKDFFNIPAGFFFDTLTCTMLCVVCGIGFFITVFAAGYMKGEEGYFRFFAYLGLFIFMMTILVMGNNLIMLYLGWEGVGLCSYLLIGYYYDRPAAREAAKKAFLVNRVGDFGFALGIMLCFLAFGTVTYFGGTSNPGQGLLELAMHPATNFQSGAMQWIPFLLMIGAFGKSAQFPLYVWLPDAMEGPTPVSALIHAATMVTAGVYMIARCGTLFVGNGDAPMITIGGIGAFTAILAATIAMRQFDLKKVFAYSTISQLGFMFVGVGCLAPVAGVFHLVTHAFFKALLFLSSGVVMHAMAGELDMRKLSGLKRVLPKTNILILIGCLALSGFPFFSGFFSKDEIVHQAMEKRPVYGVVLLITAFMTAYYTFRLYFRVFQGPEMIPDAPAGHGHGHSHDDAHAHAHASAAAVMTGDTHESGVDKGQTHHAPAHSHDDHGHHNHEPMILILPLVVLAIGALLAGYLNWPKEGLAGFLGHSPSFQLAASLVEASERAGFGQEVVTENATAVEHSPFNAVMLISGLIAIAGIGLAYWLHLKDRALADRLAVRFHGLTRLLDAKFWVDEIYQAAIVEPLRGLGVFFFAVDRFIVDGLVWLVSFIPQLSGFALKLTTQRGYLQGYALTMVFGVTVILLLFFWQRMNTILLPLLLLVPLIGAIVGAFMPNGKAARNWALFVALVTLGVGVALARQFDFKRDLTTVAPAEQLNQSIQLKWGGDGMPAAPGQTAPISISLGSIGFNVQLGMDYVSLWLVLLTVLLQPLAIAASFGSIKEREKEYYAWMNALLVAMLGVFISRDLLLFYIFFELTLIPMFFIIGIWGGPERRYAAGKFFLFTFAGSVFTLAAVIYLGYNAGGFELTHVTQFAQSLDGHTRFWLLLGFLAGFAVKVPLFPVHTWLPLAHTEAPTAGSVILAGVLLKLGTYGLLRLAIPIGLGGANLGQTLYAFYLIPGLNWLYVTVSLLGLLKWIGVFCVIGIIYGALVAWVQQDIKKLVAYSSVSHLGFCVLGLFALNAIGYQGSVLYMINHGLSTGAMFLVIGMIYDRFHTRSINELSGLARRMPIMAFFFVFFVLSSIGLPGMNGFVSEFLTILSAFTSDHLGIAYGVFAALGVILGAIYMLHMTARVIFGPLKAPGIDADGHGAQGHGHAHEPGHDDHGSLPVDLSGREIAILIPLAIVVLWLGVYPATVIKSMYGLPQLTYQSLPVQETPAAPKPKARAALVQHPALASADAK